MVTFFSKLNIRKGLNPVPNLLGVSFSPPAAYFCLETELVTKTTVTMTTAKGEPPTPKQTPDSFFQ